MKALCAAAVSVLLFGFCGGKFGVRDRYEGMKEGALRVYARVGNPGGYDEDDAAREFGPVFLQKGRDRAAMIIAATGTDRGSFPQDGKIVFLRCNDEFCEAFIDYRLHEPKKDGTRDK